MAPIATLTFTNYTSAVIEGGVEIPAKATILLQLSALVDIDDRVFQQGVMQLNHNSKYIVKGSPIDWSAAWTILMAKRISTHKTCCWS